MVDRIRNGYIRKSSKEINIAGKMRENRLRWFNIVFNIERRIMTR